MRIALIRVENDTQCLVLSGLDRRTLQQHAVDFGKVLGVDAFGGLPMEFYECGSTTKEAQWLHEKTGVPITLIVEADCGGIVPHGELFVQWLVHTKRAEYPTFEPERIDTHFGHNLHWAKP